MGTAAKHRLSNRRSNPNQVALGASYCWEQLYLCVGVHQIARGNAVLTIPEVSLFMAVGALLFWVPARNPCVCC